MVLWSITSMVLWSITSVVLCSIRSVVLWSVTSVAWYCGLLRVCDVVYYECVMWSITCV